MTDPDTTPTPHSKVSIWGPRKNPRVSITVVQGTSHDELMDVVDQAVKVWNLTWEYLPRGSK